MATASDMGWISTSDVGSQPSHLATDQATHRSGVFACADVQCRLGRVALQQRQVDGWGNRLAEREVLAVAHDADDLDHLAVNGYPNFADRALPFQN